MSPRERYEAVVAQLRQIGEVREEDRADTQGERHMRWAEMTLTGDAEELLRGAMRAGGVLLDTQQLGTVTISGGVSPRLEVWVSRPLSVGESAGLVTRRPVLGGSHA